MLICVSECVRPGGFGQVWRWSLLGLAVALSGCAVPPSPAPEALNLEVPDTWKGREPDRYALMEPVPTDLSAWWLRFNDPLLTQYVDQALAANTRVAGAQAAVRQAQALRDVAASALAPTLGVSASGQRSEAGSGSTGTGGNT